ncbi:hypothetical protein EV702DRAFT_531894 [Suillus placidus]|uniref:Uncharacterized protein n=1 Tax=Suillus placidus TaxID=48579 RepID=A0A9P6ZPK0_9AGAM|nr:hypothetical protein EV702DRAFT_531894 [Suillus placidus]
MHIKMSITLLTIWITPTGIPSILSPCKLITMPSTARALFELTRLHWFQVGCDFMFGPFALPMSDVVKNILFYALLGILVHSTGCVINGILDRDFDRKVERSKGRVLLLSGPSHSLGLQRRVSSIGA